MLFTALFAVAVVDALANGPKLVGFRLYVVALAAFLAVAFQHTLGFVAAELVLLAAFTEAAVQERQQKREALEKALAEKRVVVKVDDNELPEEAKTYLIQGRDAFFKNASGETNAFGKPWEVLQESDGIRISRSEYPKQSCKLWRAEAEITGDIDTIKRELMDYDIRCKWDTAIQSGKIIKTFTKTDVGDAFLALFYTAPAAGGVVSSREVYDLGLLIEKDGGFDYINCSVPKTMKFKEGPTKVTGERAFTHLGSGIKIQPITGTKRFKYVLVNAMDLGGWLPSSVINSATSGALLDTTKATIAQMDKLTPK